MYFWSNCCWLVHPCWLSSKHVSGKYNFLQFVNLLVPNVDLSWCVVRVFKSASQPNVDLTWREYVSNLEGLCSPLHVAELYFFKLCLRRNAKTAVWLRFPHLLRMIGDLKGMPFFFYHTSAGMYVCINSSKLRTQGPHLFLSIAECRSVISTVN